MTITNSVDTENAMLFAIVAEALEDTIVDSPEYADAADCVSFTIDMLGEEPKISETDWTEITSPRFTKLITAYAEFILCRDENGGAR